MKNLTLRALCLIFFFVPLCGSVGAQGVSDGENYYSNPQKGITPTVPRPYSEAAVVEKSDDISVELERYVPDTVSRRDSLLASLRQGEALEGGLKNAELGQDRYWQVSCCRPSGWGLFCGWDPWYTPWWHGWGPYFSVGWSWGWSWGWSPYWGIGWGWSPWWYYDWAWYWGYPYYYAWGAYHWGGYYGSGWGYGSNRAGHAYLGGGRGTSTRATTRTSGSAATAMRGRTERRGGVDVGRGSNRLDRPASTRTRTTGQTVRNAGSARTGQSALQNRSGYGSRRSIENGYRNSSDRQLGNRNTQSVNRNSYRTNSNSRSVSRPSSGSRSISSPSRSSGSFGGRGGSIGGGSRGGRR